MPLVGRRQTQRPPRLALVAGVADVVVGLVDLPGALERVARRAVMRSEPADVHLPHIEPGLAGDDPLGHQLAHATGSGDPVGAEAGCYEEAADLRLAQTELVV